MFRAYWTLHSLQTCSRQRMAPQNVSFGWIVALILFCILTEPLFAYSRGTGAMVSRIEIQDQKKPPLAAEHQQLSADPRARPRPVVVKCHPDSMEVVVQADVFNTGVQVEGKYLRLGAGAAAEGSACSAVPSGEAEFTIWAHLMDCGITLSSTEEKIIYSNLLVYSPEPSQDGLLRLDAASIPIECHYEKRYALGGVSLHPTWVPFLSTASADNQINFTLQLMTDNWHFKMGFYSYFLGDPINFEVSATILNHAPLRVYADHCVATATPDAEAPVRYDFIEHFGCLADTYLTNSSSHFLLRAEEHTLRFQLDAFRFYQEPSNQVYITCYVRAVPVTSAVNSQNRACSLINNRWRSADGNDQACASCDISHRPEENLSTEPSDTGIDSQAWPTNDAQQSLAQNRREKHPPSYSHFPSSTRQRRGAEYKGERIIQLGPITVLSPNKNDAKSTD